MTSRLQVIDKSTLLSLPRLRELHFRLEIGDSEFFRAQEQLKKFLSDVQFFRASRNFKFRFAGFDLSQTKLDRMDFTVPVDEGILWAWAWKCMEFYLNNIDLIDPNEPVEFTMPINYTNLMRHFDGKLPSCFFQKFKGIELVLADKIEDVDHFLWFLKSLNSRNSMRMLYLKYSGLDQEFYDQLPAMGHSLDRLELIEPGETSLKFDFIHNLPRLSRLIFIFRGLPSLESMSSLVGAVDKRVWAVIYWFEKNKKDGLSFDKGRDSIVWKACANDDTEKFETEKVEELLDFFERIKLKCLESRSREKSRETR